MALGPRRFEQADQQEQRDKPTQRAPNLRDDGSEVHFSASIDPATCRILPKASVAERNFTSVDLEPFRCAAIGLEPIAKIGDEGSVAQMRDLFDGQELVAVLLPEARFGQYSIDAARACSRL